MATPEGKVPIVESAGQAVRFLREHWRFGLSVAAIGAAVQTGAFALFGVTALWIVVVGIVSAFVHAAFLNVAFNGPVGVGARLAGDGLRVFASMSFVGFFISIVMFMVLYVAMSILIGPYAEEVRAAGQNNEQLMAIMDRAVTAQPNVMLWALGIAGVLVLLLTSRLYLAAPATVEQNRIKVFDSWRWTKGNLLRISATRVLLLAPALILVGVLQSIAAAIFGAPASDPAALAANAQTVSVIGFYFLAGLAQLLIYGMLEAGLSAYLYRGLRPTPPPAA
ncbi:hypothetical protein [Terricaulis sp.]|uniref:hypothetical protein n=1 Tax=Terricaulis sp. TaxID=2768686 RepID=UPI002AC386AC|nr:hypothetical protein [Terricaulis sp.]MDZ4693045.1 hypothetical protein [Terricaulis sp.]